MKWGSSYYADKEGVMHRRLFCSIPDCGHYRQLLKRKLKDGTKYHLEHSTCCRHRVDGSITRHNLPDKQKEYHWRQQGIYLSFDEYVQLFNIQEGCCFLCGVNQAYLDYKLSVDHDHETGRIRGLICKPCNAMVAWFEKTMSPSKMKEFLDTDIFEKYKDRIIEKTEFTELRRQNVCTSHRRLR